jgi:membrane protein
MFLNKNKNRNIKEIIYSNKKVIKYIILILRIIFIVFVGVKIGLVKSESARILSYNYENVFQELEHLSSECFEGLTHSFIIVLTYLSTYYAMYNYFIGINSFTLTRSKNIKERTINKIKYVLLSITDDFSILAIGIIFSILIHGCTILNLGVFLVTLFKVIIIYFMYIFIPIILSNSLNQYLTMQAIIFIITMIMSNINGTSIFFGILPIIIIFVISYYKYNKLRDEY